MTKSQKKDLIRIIVVGCMLAALMILFHTGVIPELPEGGYNFLGLGLFMVPYIIIAYEVIAKAARNISHGQVFDENFLMLVATIGAFVVGEFEEGVAVMLFYQVGELFESIAVGKSRQSIKELMDIAPEYANIEVDGKIEQVDPDDVGIGSVIIVRPGEKIPLDGIVISGESRVDTSSLTGESVPRTVKEGDEVISGCVNENMTLTVKTTKEFEDSTVSKILELVENAGSKKTKTEKFISKFAKYYTPIVVFAALAVFIIPGCITGDWFMWLERACTFLVVSCPCALVISVPMGFFAGIGVASRMGILIKGSNYLESAAELKTMVFDKTGTLTQGVFEITEVAPAEGVTENELLETAAYAEQMSTHPIAEVIKQRYAEIGGETNLDQLRDVQEISGHGVEAYLRDEMIMAGNHKLMVKNGIDVMEQVSVGTICYVAKAGKYLGHIIISDVVKEEAKEAIANLKKEGVAQTVMLTGDRKAVGEAVAKELGLDDVYTDLLPSDKVEKVEELLKDDSKRKLGFVGDGINDAPVLAESDIGFAMGAIGSDAAIEAADIVIMDDDVRKIATTARISKYTLGIVKQNITFALVVKIGIIILSAFGLTNMWVAVFGDVGVAVICILNSMRILRKKNGFLK